MESSPLTIHYCSYDCLQDTVVALQALAEFAKVAYSEGTSIKAFVEFMPLDDEDGSGEVYPFTITTLNRLVLEEETLPSIPAQVTLIASGAGCALLQVCSYALNPCSLSRKSMS